MSKIKRLKVTNYLGIQELDAEFGENINLIKGRNGKGKSSILEAVRTLYENSKTRTEMIKDKGEEALLLVEQDDNISIDRRLRRDKSDYVQMRKNDRPEKTTETLIRQLFADYIFRPIEFVDDLDSQQQTESILWLLDIPFEMEDFEKWFNEIPKPKDLDGKNDVNYDQHILQILKDIEKLYYDRRTKINRQITNKHARREEILENLPPSYDGEKWEKVEMKNLYQDLNNLQEKKRKIESAIEFTQNIQDKIDSIELKFSKKKKLVNEDAKDKIEFYENKIETNTKGIASTEKNLDKLPLLENEEINELKNEYQKELAELKEKYSLKKQKVKDEMVKRESEYKEIISEANHQIERFKDKIEGVKKEKTNEIKLIEKDLKSEKNEINSNLDEMKKVSKEDIPSEGIELLQQKINKAEEMRGYLREWNTSQGVKHEIESLEVVSDDLTDKVEKARELPSVLFRKADCPIDGLSLNDEGTLELSGLPIKNHSEGEQYIFACHVSRWYSKKMKNENKLEAIFLDGFERLDPINQEKILMELKGLQVVMTMPSAGELELEAFDADEVKGRFNKEDVK